MMGSGDRPAILVEDLRKRYGTIDALAGVSFDVQSGEILGLLGPNGAGKSTTLRILTGRARPTGGHASVFGLDVVSQRDELVKNINVVFEESNLYERLTGERNLRFFADLYGAPPARVDEVLERVGLANAARRPVRTYSTGMRQRLLIARALLNRPRVLFLDEPTRGLDPVTTRELREVIRQMGC